jgi:hypothetical protein
LKAAFFDNQPQDIAGQLAYSLQRFVGDKNRAKVCNYSQTVVFKRRNREVYSDCVTPGYIHGECAGIVSARINSVGREYKRCAVRA